MVYLRGAGQNDRKLFDRYFNERAVCGKSGCARRGFAVGVVSRRDLSGKPIGAIADFKRCCAVSFVVCMKTKLQLAALDDRVFQRFADTVVNHGGNYDVFIGNGFHKKADADQ